MGDQLKGREGEIWMAQRAKHCIKKKISWFSLREEESNELWVLHGSLAGCSQRIAWLPEHMAHQMDSLCSPDISLSTAHVHGPSTWAGLSPVFAAGPATGSTTLSLLLCEFKPYNTPFPSRLIFARTITQSPYFLSPTALCFSASAFCSIHSSSISVRLTNSETLRVFRCFYSYLVTFSFITFTPLINQVTVASWCLAP